MSMEIKKASTQNKRNLFFNHENQKILQKKAKKAKIPSKKLLEELINEFIAIYDEHKVNIIFFSSQEPKNYKNTK